MVARQIDAPDHAARIHNRLARLDIIGGAGVQDHGLQEGPVGPADHPRQDGMDAGIGHGMQQRLVARHPVLHHHRDVAPLPQARILVLEAKIFLIDGEEVIDRTRPAVEPR